MERRARPAGGLDSKDLERVHALAQTLVAEVSLAFIGSVDIPELLLTALVARGHVLLEGVPGVAKTTLVKAFSAALGCSYKRIQFTPDLLPADITGTYILNQRDGAFALRKGPIFANIVLGDEINRAPAKTQSALLEAMQESQVTIEGETLSLDPPFMVLATQNPVEQEGTYPLPEAQVDRFLMKIVVGYPSGPQERQILRAYSGAAPTPREMLGADEVQWLQGLAQNVYVEDELVDYIIALTGHTRAHGKVVLGASPRASLSLMYAARAHALLQGRDYVLPDDIKRLARVVLAHRLMLTPEADLEGTTCDRIVTDALDRVSFRRDVR